MTFIIIVYGQHQSWPAVDDRADKKREKVFRSKPVCRRLTFCPQEAPEKKRVVR